GGRVVAVEVGIGAVVLAPGCILAPVFDFGGGVDAFGDRLAARGAANGADATTDQSAKGAEETADRGAGNGASSTARGHADGMGAGCTGDWIGVLVVLVHQVGSGGGGVPGACAAARRRPVEAASRRA